MHCLLPTPRRSLRPAPARNASARRVLLLVLLAACTDGDSSIPTSPEFVPSPAKAPTNSGTVVKLPTLGGHAEAYSINDGGVAVGYSVLASGTPYPYATRWMQVAGKWVVEAVGGAGTRASALNELGTIVGDSGSSAVVWIPGRPMAILGRGEANGVNDANVVVGARHDFDVQAPAAWRQVSGEWSLTTLALVPGTVKGPTCLGTATSIGGNGVIVGYLYNNDCSQQYAVKWIPLLNPADGWEPAQILEGAAGMVKSFAYAIDGNTIVGEAWPCQVLDGCLRRAYRWSLASGSGDSGPIGSLDARANGLNASGTAVGSYLDPQKMRAVMWAPSSSAHTTLPVVSGFNTHWVWDLNNPTAGRPSRQAVGGATSDRGGKTPVVWTIP
jgi:hypothetical protein